MEKQKYSVDRERGGKSLIKCPGIKNYVTI
jgi:hypothetical protein